MQLLDELTNLTSEMNICLSEGNTAKAAELAVRLKDLLGELKPGSEGGSPTPIKKRGRPPKAKPETLKGSKPSKADSKSTKKVVKPTKAKPSKVKTAKATKTKKSKEKAPAKTSPQLENPDLVPINRIIETQPVVEAVPGRIKGGTNLFKDDRQLFQKDRETDRLLSGNLTPQERRPPSQTVTLTCSQCGRKVKMSESASQYFSPSVFKQSFKCDSCGAPR